MKLKLFTRLAALFLLSLTSVDLLLAGQVVSTFNTSNEGWAPYQNTGAVALHVPAGGNPGGYISVNDVTSDWAYLQAPSKFLVPALYNETLSFDIEVVNSPPVPILYNVRVGLIGTVGGSDMILLNESTPPTTSWVTHTFVLEETAGWRIFPDLSQNYSNAFPQPTQSEMQELLANLTDLFIATDHTDACIQCTGGIDQTHLDNVRLGVVPEPAAAVLLIMLVAAAVARRIIY